jgi:tripartite-type tricarboxylate transporter receptor subunit TctC
MTLDRRQTLGALGALALGAIGRPALAQDDFPARAVRIVAPVPPGNGSDVALRVLAREMSQITGQPFVVDNKPGGNNAIGAQAVLSAPADGYTLFFASNAAMAANVPTLKNPGYDPVGDFTPVGLAIRARWVLAVPANSPYTTIDQLVAAGKRDPKLLSAAAGSTGFQMASALFARGAGIQVNVIPYKGTPPAVQDAVGGQVSFTIADLSTVLPLIAGGKLRPLAVLSEERLPLLREVPTTREKGYGGTALHSWAALFAPAKTPAPVVQRMAALLEKATQSEAFRKYAGEVNSDPNFLGPVALASFQKGQIQAYREAMAAAGLEPQ